MGFVIAKGLDRDILVRPSDFNTAMHGDTVLVKIMQSKGGNSREQGMVESVIERKQTDFPGHIEMGEGFAFFIAETARPMPMYIFRWTNLAGAVNNDRVIVRITDWGKNKKPQGLVLQVLDEADENDRVMKEILLENGFTIVFPEKVLEESEALPETIPLQPIWKAGRISGKC